jgi:hypothetical protein
MKLSELVSEPLASLKAGCDPCQQVRSAERAEQRRPIQVLGVGRVDGGSRRMVLVENEDGFAEYMLMSADGHLGSVTDDC